VQYQVTRTGGGPTKVVCTWQAGTSCADSLPNDGTKYSYSVQARNGEATAQRETNAALHMSAASGAVSVEAAATPENVTITSFSATGVDHQAKVVFNVGASHGASNQIQCDPSCGGISSAPAGGQSGLTATIGGYTNGDTATIRIRTCNGSSGSAQTGAACSAWQSRTTTTYGPIPKPSLSVSASGQSINWSYSGNANGRPVDVTLKMGGSVIHTQTSGNGSYSASGSQNVGYSKSESFTLTVSDSSSTNGARASQSDSASATTPEQPKTIAFHDGGSAPNNTGNCATNCHWFGVTLTGPQGTYGWCSITHQGGTFRTNQTWWYRVGPTDSSGRWDGRITSSTGHQMAYNATVYPDPVNGCQTTQPSGNVDNG
jgi:hypothetical protein